MANNFTIGSSDPFDLPLTVPTTIKEPDFHYYIYDHLGNTRIVYSTELVGCGSESGVVAECTLEAVIPDSYRDISLTEKSYENTSKHLRSM